MNLYKKIRRKSIIFLCRILFSNKLKIRVYFVKFQINNNFALKRH